MARPLRIQFNGAWYHVMNRGINKKNIFHNDIQRHVFLKLLSKAITIYGIEVHAYCLMNNHYHLIVHTPRGNISDAMKYINSNYAQFVNLSMKRDGPLFKGRFKAILISADEYLISLSRYIHLNPIRAKIISSLTSYKWSSYLIYLGKYKNTGWLTTHEISKRFGAANFSKSYKEFVESNIDKPLDDLFKIDKCKPVIGDDDFCQMIDDYVKKHSISAEIVGKDHILSPPSIESILKLVASHFNVNTEKIYQPSHAVKNPARRIAIYICREMGGYHLHEIGKAMGGITYKTISNTIYRVQSDRRQVELANLLMDKLKISGRTISELQLQVAEESK